MKQDWLAWTGRGGGPPEPVGPAPSIPVANLFYLLCYATNRLEARSLVDLRALDGACPADLFAEIMLSGVRRLRMRGIPRSYRTRTEDTSSPRGRIELSPSITRGLLLSGRVECTIDELSADNATNRVLKAACRILSRRPEVDNDRRRALRSQLVELGSVKDCALTRALVERAQRERQDGLVELLLMVSELVRRAALPEANGPGRAFLDLSADPQTFGRLFEAFVLGWMHAEQSTFSARKVQVPWMAEGSVPDLALLPTMEADILLSRSTSRHLIECKAYAPTLDGRFGPGRVRSAHIYQLHTYLDHLARDEGPPISGILLYAKCEVDLDVNWRLGDHDLWVKTLDLERPWREIDGALRKLVEACAAATEDWKPTPARLESKRP